MGGLKTMISRRNLLQHFCPACDAEFPLVPQMSGQELPCPICKTRFQVPGETPAQSLDTGTDTSRPLTPEETAAFYNSPAGQAYLARKVPNTNGALARRTTASDLVPEPYERMPEARYPVPRRDNDKKVKLWFLKWFGIEVDVDPKTRSAMATTALGGILVALGAVVMAKLGLKSRS
jgi:hypothetical protein